MNGEGADLGVNVISQLLDQVTSGAHMTHIVSRLVERPGFAALDLDNTSFLLSLLLVQTRHLFELLLYR